MTYEGYYNGAGGRVTFEVDDASGRVTKLHITGGATGLRVRVRAAALDRMYTAAPGKHVDQVAPAGLRLGRDPLDGDQWAMFQTDVGPLE